MKDDLVILGKLASCPAWCLCHLSPDTGLQPPPRLPPWAISLGCSLRLVTTRGPALLSLWVYEERMGDRSHVTGTAMSCVGLTLAFLMPHLRAGWKEDTSPAALLGRDPTTVAHVQGQHLTGHP